MADGNAPDVRVEALVRRGVREPGLRRSVTLNAKRSSKGELARLQMQRNDATIEEYDRPQTRGDCLPGGCNGARPCPWVSCRAHLAIDVDERTGSLKLNFPDLDVWQMPETCAHDIADRGGVTLEEVGEFANLTRERVRQIEARGLALAAQSDVLLDYLDAPPVIRRPAPPERRPPQGRPRPSVVRVEAPAKGTPHTLARLALERGATLDEAAHLSGLSVASVRQLMWRVARVARGGAR